MELIGNLWLGLATAAQPTNLMFCLIGALLGTAVGVLPGVGRSPRSRCCCRSPSRSPPTPR